MTYSLRSLILACSLAALPVALQAQAAPACSRLGTKTPLTVLEHQTAKANAADSKNLVRVGIRCPAQCASSATSPLPLLALDMPPPVPLLIVTQPEDVAAWHTSIYDRLSAERKQADQLLCSKRGIEPYPL